MHKKLFFEISTYLIVALFLLHWVVVLLLMLPASYIKNIVASHVHPFQTNFVSWKFFTPPFTYNDRLYFIVRDTCMPGNKADTIEVLADIALQKQTRVPFNAHANIIDHLVNNCVAGLKRTVWPFKKAAYATNLVSIDSLYTATAIISLEANESYRIYIAGLTNYCKTALRQNNISTKNIEVKIVIKQKQIRPFKSIGDSGFVAKETLIYQTTFKPLTQ